MLLARLRRAPREGLSVAPTTEELRGQAARCRGLLQRSIIDFYLPGAIDPDGNGFLELADDEGRFVGSPDRFLSLQARQLWLFSTLAAAGIRRDAALAAARIGYESVVRFRDEARGGYHSKIGLDGSLADARKEICLNGFALFALAAYHRATGEQRPLEDARRLFGELEAHAHDERHGGYLELFEADWTPIIDRSAKGYWAWGDTKTVNGHMHMLETLAELHRVWPDQLVARRLAELVEINQHAVKHPTANCNMTRWSRDWQMLAPPRHRFASYGHDLEGVWLALDAARTLGWPEETLLDWAVGIADYSLEHGYDRWHGGFYVAGPVGRHARDRRKEWWAQAEALVAMLDLYRLTGDAGYYAVFGATLDFIERHQVAPGGGWWSMLREDGSRDGRSTLGSAYQDGYHSGRALMRCAAILDELGATAGAPAAVGA